MENNINDELNTSISSWNEKLMEEYENEAEKLIEKYKTSNTKGSFEEFLHNDTMSEKINEQTNVGCNGHVSVHQAGNKKVLVKYNKTDTQTNNDRTAQAINSAFLSCFTHTPFPVGTIDGSVVWRYDETDSEVKKKHQCAGAIFNFSTGLPSRTLSVICDDKYNGSKECQDSIRALFSYDKGRLHKYFVQMLIYQSFFNMYDRELKNMIIRKNGLSQIDIEDADICPNEYYPFFFNFNDYCPGIECIEKIYLLDKFADQDKTLEFIKKTANKVISIEYDTFITNYIRNCIVLDIDPKTAFEHLKVFKKTLISSKNKFFDNQPQLLITNALKLQEQLEKQEAERKLNDPFFLKQKLEDKNLPEEEKKKIAEKYIEVMCGRKPTKFTEQDYYNQKEKLKHRLQVTTAVQKSEILKEMKERFNDFEAKIKKTQFFKEDNKETEKAFYEKFDDLKKRKNAKKLQQKKINKDKPKKTLNNEQADKLSGLNNNF